jgi:hypothetical protein
MKKKNIILEYQMNDRDKLIKASEYGCYPAWLTNGKIGTFDGKPVWFGKNVSGQTVGFYADLTAYNYNTKKTARWSCDKLSQTVGTAPELTSLTPDQQKYVDDIIKNEGVIREKPSDYETNKGKYEVIDLNKKNPSLFPQAGKAFVYKQIGAINTDKLDPEGIIEMLVTSHNAKREISPTESEMYTKVNLQTYENGKYAPHFVKEFYLYFPKEEVNIQDLLLDVKTKFDSQKVDKKQCRQAIDLLYTAYENKYGMKDSDRTAYKEYVKKCSAQNTIPMFSKNKFETLSKLNPKRSLYSLREGVEMDDLSKLIRENLNELTETKKKNLVEEHKIINNRFKIISEGKNLKTKKGKKQLVSDLVTESIYLTEQGFTPQLINEDFIDFMKSLFPKGAIDPVMETTKEFAVEWLFKKLNLDPKGWMGSMVSTAIGNIDIADVPKLWSDCSYVTGLLSESIVEGGLKKIQGTYLSTSSDPGLQGMVYDTMRNTIMEALKATDFAQQLQLKLSEIVCPLIGQLGTKVSDATELMKNKALGLES